MNSVFLDLGFIKIRWYSVIMTISIFLAYFIISKEAKKKKLNEDKFLDMAFYGILIGILGARVYYVLFNLDYYLHHFKEIFMIWHGGLAIHGALIAALVFLLIYTKKKNINIKVLLDAIVVGLIIAQSLGRWGNFFNQEAYGRDVTRSFLTSLFLPNIIVEGMKINGIYREPTFLYESISSLICFILLIILRRKNIKTGTLTSVYLIWYGITRFIIEGLRTDSLMLGPLRVAQLVSVIAIVSGIIYLIISIKKNRLYKEDDLIIEKRRTENV